MLAPCPDQRAADGGYGHACAVCARSAERRYPRMDGSHPGHAPHHGTPNPLAMALHLFRTFALGGSLLGDRRIHPARKVAFVTILGVVIAAALGVDVAGEVITQGLNIIPGLGALLGVGPALNAIVPPKGVS